ncbi:MAG: hemerythrin domain-containing protein [Candidatus Omnitrophica bacterium]|nr:hemerythrin domain-containing protein [Candidatus Omnitrophota bacterium]
MDIGIQEQKKKAGSGSCFQKDHQEFLQKSESLHQVFKNICYEGKLLLGRNLRRAGCLLQFFETRFVKHLEAEEKVLYPFIETHIPRYASVILFFHREHKDLQETLGELRQIVEKLQGNQNYLRNKKLIETIQWKGAYFNHLLRSHIKTEVETVLYAFDRELRREERQELLEELRQYQLH